MAMHFFVAIAKFTGERTLWPSYGFLLVFFFLLPHLPSHHRHNGGWAIFFGSAVIAALRITASANNVD